MMMLPMMTMAASEESSVNYDEYVRQPVSCTHHSLQPTVGIQQLYSHTKVVQIGSGQRP